MTKLKRLEKKKAAVVPAEQEEVPFAGIPGTEPGSESEISETKSSAPNPDPDLGSEPEVVDEKNPEV